MLEAGRFGSQTHSVQIQSQIEFFRRFAWSQEHTTLPAESAFAADDGALFADAEWQVTATQQNEDGVYQLTYSDGQPVDMDFEYVTSGTITDSYEKGVDYQVRYFVDSDNSGDLSVDDARVDGLGTDAPSACGDYIMVGVWGDGMNEIPPGSAVTQDFLDNAYYIEVPFEVVPLSISDVKAFEVNPDNAQDVSDTTFVYDGKAIQVGLAIGPEVLEYGTDYTVTVNNGAPSNTSDGTFALTSGATNAGTYKVQVTGAAGYFGKEQTVTLEIEVAKLDLTEAVVFAPDFEDKAIYPDSGKWYEQVTVNGDAYDDAIFVLTQTLYEDVHGNDYGPQSDGFVYINSASDQRAPEDLGTYTFALTPKNDAAKANITGEATLKINVVDTLATITYDGEGFFGYFNGKTFYGDEWTFDKSLAKASEGTVSVVLRDAEGNVVDAPSAAGRYTVTARVDVPSTYAVGGAAQAEFTYFKGLIDGTTTEVVATINGENVKSGGSWSMIYNGTAVTPVIAVKSGDAVLAEGADYTVEYKNLQGQAVDSMVDAGTYTVTVRLSDDYVYENGGTDIYEFTVVIEPREFDHIKAVMDAVSSDLAETPGYLYTGSAITPVFEGTYEDNTGNIEVPIELEDSWYKMEGLTYKAEGSDLYVPAESVLEVGDYKAYIVPTNANPNYTWDESVQEVDFKVIAKSAFSDVDADAWYADEVSKAFKNHYIDGMGNNLFFPNAPMTREQFAQVVYNMAGEPVLNWWTPGTYPTKYSDVSESAWSAKAISWATEAGIVNGTSDTTFDPEGDITREQIATMLYRYAGNGAQADASVLDDFVDGDEVSDWAVNAMAWAVEEGYMQGKGANDLQPQATATRAEVAALSVRVQPEMLPRS